MKTIAERMWLYLDENGIKSEIPVRFASPYQAPDGFWEATFSIFWPDGQVTERRGTGVDSLDALQVALKIFSIECRDLEAEFGPRLQNPSGVSLANY